QQRRLCAGAPWNVVRLILPREPEPAVAAAATLHAWRAAGVLAVDAEPALYFYSQEFALRNRSAPPAAPPPRAPVPRPEAGPAGAAAGDRRIPEPDLRALRAARRAPAGRRRRRGRAA